MAKILFYFITLALLFGTQFGLAKPAFEDQTFLNILNAVMNDCTVSDSNGRNYPFVAVTTKFENSIRFKTEEVGQSERSVEFSLTYKSRGDKYLYTVTSVQLTVLERSLVERYDNDMADATRSSQIQDPDNTLPNPFVQKVYLDGDDKGELGMEIRCDISQWNPPQ